MDETHRIPLFWSDGGLEDDPDFTEVRLPESNVVTTNQSAGQGSLLGKELPPPNVSTPTGSSVKSTHTVEVRGEHFY